MRLCRSLESFMNLQNSFSTIVTYLRIVLVLLIGFASIITMFAGPVFAEEEILIFVENDARKYTMMEKMSNPSFMIITLHQ